MRRSSGGEEVVALVDEDDRVVGSSPLAACLRKGLLHRAVAVLIERHNGKVLLQRRSKTDAWMPGKLTLSCTGHVRKGETYLAAARRELAEELGLRSRLKHVGKVVIPKVIEGPLTEWEIATLFLGRSDSTAVVDRTELEGVVEVSRPELSRLSRSLELTYDARLLLSKFILKQRRPPPN